VAAARAATPRHEIDPRQSTKHPLHVIHCSRLSCRAMALPGHAPLVLSGEAARIGLVQCALLHHPTHPPVEAA